MGVNKVLYIKAGWPRDGFVREGVNKTISCEHVLKRGGGGKPPAATFEKNSFSFFLKREEKDAEYSETEKYVFC